MAPSMSAFKNYVTSEAVAYERVLLGRVRVIGGADKIANDAREALRCAVNDPKRADTLLRDFDRARAQKLRRDRASSEWDIDRIEGGRCDVELIISTLIFRHASVHPSLQTLEIPDALDAMVRAEIIDPSAAKSLKSARAFWSRIQIIRALACWSDPISVPIRARLAALISRAGGVAQIDELRPLMRGHCEEMARTYAQFVLGRPPVSIIANSA